MEEKKKRKNGNDCESENEKGNVKGIALWSGAKRRGSESANVHLKLSLNELQRDPPRIPVVLQKIPVVLQKIPVGRL